jgi:hypothetical protein
MLFSVEWETKSSFRVRNLRRVFVSRGRRPLVSSHPYVRVSAGIIADPNGRIVVKGLLRKSVGELQIWLKWDKNIGHCTYWPDCVSYCWQWNMYNNNTGNAWLCFHGKAFDIYYIVEGAICTSTIQRERIFVFPWQHWLPERDAVLTLYERAHCLPRSSFLVCLCKTASFVAQFEVLNVVIMIFAFFTNVASCSLVGKYQRAAAIFRVEENCSTREEYDACSSSGIYNVIRKITACTTKKYR